MTKNPIISVILPYFNAEATLERAILSILNQSFKDFELILVNNNSSDKGEEIAKEYARKDSRLILVDENKQGVVFASNTGTALSKGKYISRMDADDEALENKLALQSKFLDENQEYDAVGGLAKYIPHSDQTGGFARFVDWSNSIRTYEEIKNNRFIELPIINPTLMWRKESSEKYGLYRSGDFPEDYEMILRWLDAGGKIGKIPERVLKWYDSDGRLTRTEDIYSEQSFYKIKSKYLFQWLKANNPQHPIVSVWGASRISRRRANILQEYGIEIGSYIDTKRGRQIEKEIIYYKDLPPPGDMFILTYIKQMDNRDRIRKFLNDKGYEEGVNYLMVS